MRGTKRKRRDGVWELRVYVGRDPETGKPCQLSKTFYGNARAADEALRDLVDRYGAGSRSDGLGATLGQLLDKWLDECRRLDRSPTTLRNYRHCIERTIRPRLGSVKLTRLTPKNLDDLYGEMKAAGSSPKTIRNAHAILSSALHQGVRWGWVRDNVAERARPPSVGQRLIHAPSVEDVQAIVEAGQERDPRLGPLLMLAALTGMRRGELCALRWSDMNLDAGAIEVTRAVIIDEGGISEKATKTNRGRVIALDPVAVEVLLQHRSNTEGWARAVGADLSSSAYVFSPEIDGSRPFRPDHVTGFFIRVRDGLGLRHVRLHDLRHFTATQLIGAGVDVRTVAGRLGHADPSITLRTYSHTIQERDRAAATIMGNVLRPK